MTCCDVSRGVSALFSLTLSWVNAAPSRRTISNFKVWSWHSGPDLDVMDNPSSVITQVSRDEEGNKAAGERGKLLIYLYYIYINFFLNTPVQSCQGKKGKEKFCNSWTPSLSSKLLMSSSTDKASVRKVDRKQVRARRPRCCVYIMAAALWPLMKSKGNDVQLVETSVIVVRLKAFPGPP